MFYFMTIHPANTCFFVMKYTEMVSVYIKPFSLVFSGYLTGVSNSSHTISHIFQHFLDMLVATEMPGISRTHTWQTLRQRDKRWTSRSPPLSSRTTALTTEQDTMFGYRLEYVDADGQEWHIQEDLNAQDPVEWALVEYLEAGSKWTDLHLIFEDGRECMWFAEEFRTRLEKHLSESATMPDLEPLAPESVPEPARKPRRSWFSDIFNFKR